MQTTKANEIECCPRFSRAQRANDRRRAPCRAHECKRSRKQTETAMAFFLVRLEPDPNGGDKMLDVPIPDYGPYEKGPEAAKAAKDLTTLRGYKVQPRRIHQAPDWRARQQD